jgi:hypothetical protein
MKLLADENFDNTIIEVTSDAPIGRVIEDIILLLSCSLDGELEGQIFYLPL